MCAEVLQAQLLSRLRFASSTTADSETDPLAKALLTEAPAVYGCCSGEGSALELLWLDEVVGSEGTTCPGAWQIQYNVCKSKVEGDRVSELRYEALLLPDANAPEGFAFTIPPAAA